MPRDQLEASYFSPDILEFIGLLHTHAVRYVVVGGEAVIYYGHARLTGDIDFFYDASDENTAALFQALTVFWGGRIPGIERVEELREEGIIIQFGVPPNRIDLLNRIDGVTFAEAWKSHAVVIIRTATGEVPLFYLGLADLIRNKAAISPPNTRASLSADIPVGVLRHHDGFVLSGMLPDLRVSRARADDRRERDGKPGRENAPGQQVFVEEKVLQVTGTTE